MDDPVPVRGTGGEGGGLGEVRDPGFDAGFAEDGIGVGGAAEAGDMMAFGGEAGAEGEAEVTAAGEENAHGRRMAPENACCQPGRGR